MKKTLPLAGLLLLFVVLSGCNSSISTISDKSDAVSSQSIAPQLSQPESAPSTDDSSSNLPLKQGQISDSSYLFVLKDNKEKGYLVSFDFPEGLYLDNTGIIQAEFGVVPYDIYNPVDENDPLHRDTNKVGEVHIYSPPNARFIDDETILLESYGEYETYVYSDDESLPSHTFYRIGDTLVFTTEETVFRGENIRRQLKITEYYIPLEENEHAYIIFFHNPDSTGAKEYFESIINTVEIQEIYR